MDSVLLDAFRHNAWATQALLDFCRDLPGDQLTTSTPGVFGGTLDTLQHLVLAEAGYHRLVTGIASRHPPASGTSLSLHEIDERAREVAALWEMALSQPIDVDRMIPTRDDDGNRYETAIGVVLAQVLNHGNEHRGQICTVLTTIGIEPPVLHGWTYGIASGRAVAVSQS